MKNNFFQKLCICLLCMGCFCSLFACARSSVREQSTTAKQTTTKQVTTKAITAKPTTTAPQVKEDTTPLLNYDHLTKGEKEVYNRLGDTIGAYEPYMEESVTEFKAEVVDRVFFYSFLADHPEYFYVRGNSNLYEYSGTGEEMARFDIKYIDSIDEYDARMAKIDGIFAKIKKSLPKGATDFDRAKAVYDYLIEHVAYDYDYTGNSLKESETTSSYADGALVDGKAVCSGYSRAFKMMMDRFGIPCMCVSNKDHEWNIVRIEGNCYHIDVTWADTAENSGERYFCVTDTEIYKDHDKPAYAVPECTVVNSNLAE
ncbi:MAG: hypothetical protein IJG23_01425 [Clostridia bacterium]|nr:hypothetical protein [Clostridia bacterium]